MIFTYKCILWILTAFVYVISLSDEYFTRYAPKFCCDCPWNETRMSEMYTQKYFVANVHDIKFLQSVSQFIWLISTKTLSVYYTG